MIIERSHEAGAVSPIGQHCARCHGIINEGPVFYASGQRVGVIIAPVAEVSSHYPVVTVTRETPRMCGT